MARAGGSREVRGIVAVLTATGATIALVLVGLVVVRHLRPLSTHAQAISSNLASPAAASTDLAAPSTAATPTAFPSLEPIPSPLSLQSVNAILSAIPSHLPTPKAKAGPTVAPKPTKSTSASSSAPVSAAPTSIAPIPASDARVVIVNETTYELSVTVDGFNTTVNSGTTSAPLPFEPSPGDDSFWAALVPYPSCKTMGAGAYHLTAGQEYRIQFTTVAGCVVNGTDYGVPITIGNPIFADVT